MTTHDSQRLPTPRLIHIIGANRWREPWRHALDVCRHFRDAGWYVTAYTRDSQAIDSRFRNAGIDLRHSPLRGIFDLWSAMQLARDLKNEHPDTIIHVHRYRDAFAVLLARKIARRPDIKVVSTRHTLHPGATHYIARRIYRNLDAQLFVSQAVRQRFLSSWRDGKLPFDINRTHIISPTVNIPLSEPVAEPERGPKIILCRASMQPGNGLETLIDAMTALRGRKTRLWLVGQGDSDYIDTLRRRAQTRGVMEMIDWKLRIADSVPLIDEAHISADPSTVDTPLGPSHIEIMAHERPQILSAAISPSEFVKNGREVIIVPPNNAAKLGEELLRLVEDPRLRRQIGANARQTYLANFTWPKTVSAIENLYATLRQK